MRSKLFASLALVVGIVSIFTASANAASSLPDPSQFTTSVRLIVGNANAAGAGISAPTSITKIYSTSPTISITINGFDQCPGDSYDYLNPGVTRYEVYATNASETRAGGFLARSDNGTACGAFDTRTMNVTHPGPPSARDGHTGLYVFEFQATLLGGSFGFNGFNINVPGQNVGYSELSGNRFALKSSFSESGGPTYATYNIRFAPSCEVTAPINRSIEWYDADQGQPNQLMTIAFDLIDETTGAVIVNNKTDLGGQNVPGSLSITFQPGHRYRWVWKNVSSYNGIQFSLPFDSFYYNTTCDDPDDPQPSACPTFSPTTRTVALPPSGIPASNDAERHNYANRTEVNSIPDEWGQQADWTGGNNGSVDVDYRPFVRDYPYDIHTVTVYYTVYYTTDHYVNQPINNPDYNGNGLPDDGTTDNWVYQYTSGPHATSQQQADAPDINPPCYNRTYDTTPEHQQAQLFTDEEEVTSASFGYRFTTDFAVTQSPANPDQVRERSQLSLPYELLYYVDRWDTGADPTVTVEKTFNTSAPTNRAVVNDHVVDETHVQDTFVAPGPSNLRAGDRICFRVRIPLRSANPRASGGRGQMAVNNQLVSGAPQSAGTVIAGTVAEQRQTNDLGPNSENGFSCTPIAVNRPYFRAYGGDVVAGSNFKSGGSCSAIGNAGIFSWNRESRPSNSFYGNTPNGGAGVQLAAYATGIINGFASAAGRGSVPTPMNGLSFANDSDPAGNWGTQYIGCMPDYYSYRTGPTITSPANFTGASNGSFQGTGPFTFTGGMIPGGGIRRYTLYIEGDLAITGDLSQASTLYNDLAEIPSIRLIATGNVYIAPNVTTLNAVIISQGGTIYTCSNGGFAEPSVSQMVNPNYAPIANSCRKKLTVNGALLASRIRFFRSIGSLRNSTDGELSSSGNIAETVNYTPELWLALPSDIPYNDQPYDAYRALPPIL